MYFDEKAIFRFRGPFGIPVEIGFSTLVLILIYLEFGKAPQAFVFDLMFVVLILLSIFLHEVGHAFGAVIQGVPVRRIGLNAGGGYCERGGSVSPQESELIVAMGPIVNLTLWALASLIWPLIHDPEIRWVFAALAWINLYLAIFNLIPVMPLDGGKLFYLILLRFAPEAAAERISGLVGLFFALIWIPLLMLSFLMTGLILFFLPSIPYHWKLLRGVT